MTHITRGIPLGTESNAMLDRLETALQRRGVRPHPACRYSDYKRELRARSRLKSREVPSQDEQYAFAELWQMDWIVACFQDDDAKWRLIEEAFFQDPPVPHSETVHSPGRDRQFELYVAARLQMAGLPIAFSEPDICSSLDQWPFVVAAKRVKSRRRLLRQLKSARDQIHKAGRDGVVVVDYSLVAARESRPFIGDLDAGHAWFERFAEVEFHDQWSSIADAVCGAQEVLVYSSSFDGFKFILTSTDTSFLNCS